VSLTPPTFEVNELGGSRKEIESQIQRTAGLLSSQGRIFMFCLYGRQLLALKDSVGRMDSSTFESYVNGLVPSPISTGLIYFYISLYKLSVEYPRLRHVNLSYSELRTKFTQVKRCMEMDSNFWKMKD
jgi:hypothetical protein